MAELIKPYKKCIKYTVFKKHCKPRNLTFKLLIKRHDSGALRKRFVFFGK